MNVLLQDCRNRVSSYLGASSAFGLACDTRDLELSAPSPAETL